MTPREMWTGQRPDLSHLRVFGCVAYAQLAKERRVKLDNTSIQGIFVGYTPTTRQYRIYNPKTGVVERYSTVRFDENRQGGTLLSTPGGTPEDTPLWTEDQDAQDNQDQVQVLDDIGDTIVVRPAPPTPPGSRAASPAPPESQPAPPRSQNATNTQAKSRGSARRAVGDLSECHIATRRNRSEPRSRQPPRSSHRDVRPGDVWGAKEAVGDSYFGRVASPSLKRRLGADGCAKRRECC
jgi:hypothetical protein